MTQLLGVRRKKSEKKPKKGSIAERFAMMNKRRPEDNLQNDLQYLYEAMQKYSKRHWFSTYENAECIKCSEVHKLMVTVGALKFCHVCFGEEFDSKAKERNDEIYKKWYKVFEEKINLAFEEQSEYMIGDERYEAKSEEEPKIKIRRKRKTLQRGNRRNTGKTRHIST